MKKKENISFKLKFKVLKRNIIKKIKKKNYKHKILNSMDLSNLIETFLHKKALNRNKN